MERRYLLKSMATFGAISTVPILVRANNTAVVLPPTVQLMASLKPTLQHRFETSERCRIGIIGVGNAGRNMLLNIATKLPGISGTVELNTHSYEYSSEGVYADQTILLSNRSERTWASDLGTTMSKNNVATILDAIGRFDIIFIVAGMGGSTGTKVAPVVAEIARRAKVVTIGVPITPFDFEGYERQTIAARGVAALQVSCDAVVKLSNEQFAQSWGESVLMDSLFLSVSAAFLHLCRCVLQSVKAHGYVTVDFAEILQMLTQVGDTSIGLALGASSNSIDTIALKALEYPILGAEAIGKAKSILVTIRSGKGQVGFSEKKLALLTIRTYASPDACIMYAATVDPLLGSDVELCILATGIQSSVQISKV